MDLPSRNLFQKRQYHDSAVVSPIHKPEVPRMRMFGDADKGVLFSDPHARALTNSCENGYARQMSMTDEDTRQIRLSLTPCDGARTQKTFASRRTVLTCMIKTLLLFVVLQSCWPPHAAHPAQHQSHCFFFLLLLSPCFVETSQM